MAEEAVNRQRSRGASEAAGDELDAGRAALDAEREQRELDERIALAEREIERGHREAVSERATLRNLRAMQRFRRGDHDGAFAEWNELIDEDPRQDDVLFMRATFNWFAGNLDAAVADLSRAIELEPNHTGALQHRAFCYERRGELELAIADYTRAIELKPEAAAFWSGRGEAYLKLGAYENAMTDLTQAIVLHDGYEAEAYWLRGHARRKRGDLEGAREDYRQALWLDESLLEELERRGRMDSLLGTTAEQMESFRLASAQRRGYKQPVVPSRARRTLGGAREEIAGWIVGSE